jgi:hypothetical protein
MERTPGSLRELFESGVAAAMDPANASSVGGGAAVTTLRSRWLHLRCLVCKHTFRAGDEVEVVADGSVRHRSALLPCAGSSSIDLGSPEDTTSFFEGLDEAWPPPRDLPVRRLVEGDLHVAAPVAGFRRQTCAVCGHTLRVNDQVILCPCSPGAPMCVVAIHRDPVRGLHCWEAWSSNQNQQHCPATSRKLHG